MEKKESNEREISSLASCLLSYLHEKECKLLLIRGKNK